MASTSHHLPSRRQLLAAGTGFVSLMAANPPSDPSKVLAGSSVNDASLSIIDTNVSLFSWPFRKLPLDQTDLLDRKLQSLNILQAWACSFEALLHRDLSAVNARLADECQRYPRFVPVGAINPLATGWKSDLKQCAETHGMPAIRLFPGYHRYELNAASLQTVLELATEAGLIVQLVLSMEDVRTQSDMLRVADANAAMLLPILKKLPKLRLQLLNHKLKAPLLRELTQHSGIAFDTARIDGTDGVPQLVNAVPPGRVLFGSHSPFLIPEAALIRVHESGLLDGSQLNAVYSQNAVEFLKGRHA